MDAAGPGTKGWAADEVIGVGRSAGVEVAAMLVVVVLVVLVVLLLLLLLARARACSRELGLAMERRDVFAATHLTLGVGGTVFR